MEEAEKNPTVWVPVAATPVAGTAVAAGIELGNSVRAVDGKVEAEGEPGRLLLQAGIPPPKAGWFPPVSWTVLAPLNRETHRFSAARQRWKDFQPVRFTPFKPVSWKKLIPTWFLAPFYQLINKRTRVQSILHAVAIRFKGHMFLSDVSLNSLPTPTPTRTSIELCLLMVANDHCKSSSVFLNKKNGPVIQVLER